MSILMSNKKEQFRNLLQPLSQYTLLLNYIEKFSISNNCALDKPHWL